MDILAARIVPTALPECLRPPLAQFSARRVHLDCRVRELVTYLYALLDDEAVSSLATSRVMLQQSIAPSNLPAYKKGVAEAAAIVEMLLFHKNDRAK